MLVLENVAVRLMFLISLSPLIPTRTNSNRKPGNHDSDQLHIIYQESWAPDIVNVYYSFATSSWSKKKYFTIKKYF